MIAIVGIFIVFAAILSGFLMEKGHILVLLQPAEFLIIAGAASGTPHPVDMRATMREGRLKIKEREVGDKTSNQSTPAST